MNLIQIQEEQRLIESEQTIESLEVHEPPVLVETASDQVLIDGEGSTEIIEAETPVLIETSAGQGIQGPRGAMGPRGEVEVSSEINNRLVMKPGGLYVSDDLVPDPVAYYTLARG